MANTEAVTLGAGQRRVSGDIAARIDRLPLTRLQYSIGLITQVFWGIVIANDAISASIYPFIWGPDHILSTLQWDIAYGANVGAGICVGEYIAGYLADAIGRKKVLMIGALWDAVFLWPIAFHSFQSFWFIVSFNFIYAWGMGAILATNATYLHEIVAPEVRGRMSLRTQSITALIGFMPALLSYFWIPSHWNWVVYGLATAVIVILMPLGGFFLPESPRWLEAKGRDVEADVIVSRWEHWIEARTGPLPIPAVNKNPVIESEKVPVNEVFKGMYGRRTALLLAVWFFGYAGIIYGPGAYLPVYLVDRHWTAHELFLVVGILRIPIGFATFWIAAALNERAERKTLAAWGGLIFAAGYLLLMTTDAKVADAVLILIAGPGGTLFLFSLYNYTAVAYPTRLRAVGTGWTDGVGHLGAFLAPLVAGPLFTATATAAISNYGWILWITIPCGIFPALLIARGGIKQREGVLEQVST